MLAVLERDIELEKDEPIKYCHVSCTCSPKMGLCGAYKPVPCNVSYVDNKNTCPRCKRPVCPDCEEEIEFACMRCGL